MTMGKFDLEKFTSANDFSLRRIKMKSLLVHHGLADAIDVEHVAEKTDKKKAGIMT